jgi:hypothetical protein
VPLLLPAPLLLSLALPLALCLPLEPEPLPGNPVLLLLLDTLPLPPLCLPLASQGLESGLATSLGPCLQGPCALVLLLPGPALLLGLPGHGQCAPGRLPEPLRPHTPDGVRGPLLGLAGQGLVAPGGRGGAGLEGR